MYLSIPLSAWLCFHWKYFVCPPLSQIWQSKQTVRAAGLWQTAPLPTPPRLPPYSRLCLQGPPALGSLDKVTANNPHETNCYTLELCVRTECGLNAFFLLLCRGQGSTFRPLSSGKKSEKGKTRRRHRKTVGGIPQHVQMELGTLCCWNKYLHPVCTSG